MGNHTAELPVVSTDEPTFRSPTGAEKPEPVVLKRWAVFEKVFTLNTEQPEYLFLGLLDEVSQETIDRFYACEIVKLPDLTMTGAVTAEVQVDRLLANHEALMGLSNKEARALPPNEIPGGVK